MNNFFHQHIISFWIIIQIARSRLVRDSVNSARTNDFIKNCKGYWIRNKFSDVDLIIVAIQLHISSLMERLIRWTNSASFSCERHQNVYWFSSFFKMNVVHFTKKLMVSTTIVVVVASRFVLAILRSLSFISL